jgi:hypothetical protein
MSKKTPIKAGSLVRFIEDVPCFGLQKGDSAFVEVECYHKYEIIDGFGCWRMVDKSSVVHINDYIEE